MSESLRRDYEIGAEIGRGRFGVVRRCSSIATAELFAVKSVDKSLLSDDLDRDLADREAKLAVLASAGGANPHVVQIHAVYEDADSLHIVMDLCPGPDLFDRISRHGPLAEPEAAAVMEPLMTAVAACHRRGVAHRDIKPDNVLFDAEGRLRLADFGSAACFDGEEGLHMRGIVGTAYYAAPEVVAGREYGEKVDVWSAAVVLYMMLSGAPPFGGDTAVEVFEAVMRGNLRFPTRLFRDMSPAAKDLIRRMICKCVSRRFLAEQVLESVVVVESDNADMDVETFYDGYLAAIMVEEGGLAPVGSAITHLVETEDEIPNARSQASSSPTSSAAPPPAAAPSPEILASTPPPPPPTPKAAPVVSTHPTAEGGRIIATPYAKKLAKDLKGGVGDDGRDRPHGPDRGQGRRGRRCRPHPGSAQAGSSICPRG